MKQKQLESRAYSKPLCEMIEAETETFICQSPKLSPSAPGFEEEDWEDKGDLETDENEFE